jgi:microcystin-dependent protein
VINNLTVSILKPSKAHYSILILTNMKTKLLFLSVLMLLAVFGSIAQITTTGVAIQGIARNAATNNAISNTLIGLKFTVYYYNGTTLTNAIVPVNSNVTTDAFGVFSYTLDVSLIENKIIYDNQLRLKIEQTSPSTGVISDENLNFVPYAVSASNGVPTGSIMPFIGTVAPRGWILCDGGALPGTALELKALLGGASNAPDLRGMFIRGAGTNSNSSYSTNIGPNLKEIQADSLKSHLHASGTIITDTKGAHNHGSTSNMNMLVKMDRNFTSQSFDMSDNELNLGPGITIPMDGGHNHIISGSTATTGFRETRPVNYGVNYIIKL